MAWYLINGRISSSRAEAITEYIDTRLLPRLRPHVISLVDAFELDESLVRSTLAKDEAERLATINTLVRN
jgi:acyl-CoA oxidase